MGGGTDELLQSVFHLGIQQLSSIAIIYSVEPFLQFTFPFIQQKNPIMNIIIFTVGVASHILITPLDQPLHRYSTKGISGGETRGHVTSKKS